MSHNGSHPDDPSGGTAAGEGARERLETLASQLEAAHDRVADAERRIEALEEENAALREELDDVRAEVRDATDLLQLADGADALGWRQKQVLLVKNAAEEARDRADDEPASAALTASEARIALQRSVDRTTVYDLFDEVANKLFADSDVVRYVKEPRGHDPPSRLVVDLEAGALPVAVDEASTGGG